MSKNIHVDDEVVEKAYNNFKRMFFPEGRGVGLHMWAFVGLKGGPYSIGTGGWSMPEENAKFVRMLAGPHHEALARAMLANGHQYKIPVGHN